MVPEPGKRAKAMRWFKNDDNAIAELIPSPRMDDDLIAPKPSQVKTQKVNTRVNFPKFLALHFAPIDSKEIEII
jgi:hypothetical protein